MKRFFYRGACLRSILLCLRSLLLARRRLTQAGITASDWLWAPPICYALRSLRSIKTDFSSIFDHRLFTITSPYCLIFTVYYPFCFFFSFGTLRLVSSAAVFWDVTQCPPPPPHKKKETGTAAHIRTTFLSWSQLPFHFVPNSPFEQPCPARECFFLCIQSSSQTSQMNLRISVLCCYFICDCDIWVKLKKSFLSGRFGYFLKRHVAHIFKR